MSKTDRQTSALTRRAFTAGALAGVSGTLSFRSAVAAETLNIGILKIAGVCNAWVAQQQGMFAKNGLTAKLTEFNSGADAVNAAQSGDVDVVLSIIGSAMTAIERGFDLLAVFQNEVGRRSPPDSSSVQVVDASPIKSVADLKGKKIGVQSLNSQQVVGVQLVLKKANVDLKTVQFIEMPFPALPNALRGGLVDAVVLVDPFTTQVANSGGRVLSWSYVDSIPGQPLGVWLARKAVINSRPAAISAFNAAMKESIDYMNADEARARKDVAAFTGLPGDIINKMPPPSLDYRVDYTNWQKVIDMMREFGVLKKADSPDRFMADAIKPYILKS